MGALGDDYNDDRPGYVKVYERSQCINLESWSNPPYEDTNANGDLFEDSLSSAISLDSNTLAVGAPGYFDKNDRPGYVKTLL